MDGTGSASDDELGSGAEMADDDAAPRRKRGRELSKTSEEPPWVQSLKDSLVTNVSSAITNQLATQLGHINERVNTLQGEIAIESNERKQDMQSISKRLDDLETTISNNLKPISPSFRAVPPPREDKWPTGNEDSWQRPAAPSGVRVPTTSPLPAISSTDPWGRYAQKGAVSGGDSRVDSASGSPSPTSFQDTDFCKIIAGGWETDTPRSVIAKEVAQCISQ